MLRHLLLLALFPSAAMADWPQWRGPERNGLLGSGPKLADTAPADGFPALWESEMIPSNDEGGLSSPVAAGGRVFMSVVWHSDVPSETRQISDLVLRQLGFLSLAGLDKAVVEKMEQTRLSLPPGMRGKKLEEFAEQWSKENVPPGKLHQMYAGYVKGRFQKGKLAVPQHILEALDKKKQHVFANEGEMKAWLAEQNWPEDVVQQIVAAVPPTKRVAEDVILCVDLKTGKTLWKATAPGEPTGRNSSSTPCVADGKVFALGSTQAYCVDAGTGKQLWAAPLAQKGTGASPLYVDGVLIVNARYLSGLDAKSGEQLWKQEKAGGGNSSPVSWKGGGKTLAVCNGRNELQAVDIRTGEIVWGVPGSGDSTPAISGDLLCVQSRKPELGLVAYKLTANGAQKAWNYPMEPFRTQSSPILHDGFVYLIDDNNSYCFDAANGSQRWQEPMQANITSPIVADGKIWVLTNNGNTVTIMKPDPGSRIELGKATIRAAWVPSPAIADGKLIVRLKDKLKCFDIAAK